MLKITAAFTHDGSIIGAIVHHDTKRDEKLARAALKNETAKRLEKMVREYETLDLATWLERGQLLEVDVGHDIVKAQS